MYNPVIADMVSMAGRAQRSSAGGEIVSKTLDAVNNSGFSALNKMSIGVSNNADYAFQTSVLNAAYTGRGALVDIMI